MCGDVKSDTTARSTFVKGKHFILLLSSLIMLFFSNYAIYSSFITIQNDICHLKLSILTKYNGKLKDVNS